MNNNSKTRTVVCIVFCLIFTYLYDFYFQQNTFNNFWCVSMEDFNFLGFGLNLPIHCDEGPYFMASESIEYFLSDQNPYQKRPIYIFTISMVRLFIKPLSLLGFSDYLIFRISMLIIQAFVIFIIIRLYNVVFKVKIFDLNYYLCIFGLLFIPNIKWNIFFPSFGNLTLLASLLFLGVSLKSIKFLNSDPKIYLFFGMLSMLHRTFLILGFILLLIKIFETKNYKLITNLKNVIFLLSSQLLYELMFVVLSLESFDWNKEIYGQFYWILDRIKGVETINNIEFCQSFGTFLNCYISKTWEYIMFFHIPIIYLFICYSLFFIKFGHITEQIYVKYLLISSLSIYVFWSISGYYPNFRFINYSLGYLIFLNFIFLCRFNFYNKNLLMTSVIVFQLSINYLEPYKSYKYEYDFMTLVSCLLFAIFIFKELRYRDTHVVVDL